MTELLADNLGEDFGIAERSWDGAAGSTTSGCGTCATRCAPA